MINSNLIFTPGPVKMSEDILLVGSKQPPYFRNESFSKVIKFCSEELLKMVGAGENASCIFLSSSGSGAMDAVIANFINTNDKSIIINGGTFGNRFVDINKFYEFDYTELKLEFGVALTKKDLDLINIKEHSIFMIQGHETSSGVKHDLNMTGEYCKENNLLHIVDGITSFLVDDINMIEQNIDVLIIGSQKGLALPPGLSLVILSNNAKLNLNYKKANSYYFDFRKYIDDLSRYQTPFTPTVGIILQLEQRIKNILKNGGFYNEISKCNERANYFRKKISNFPLKIISDFKSNGVTTLSPTDGKNSLEIVNDFEKLYNISICPNGAPYSDMLFRVSHMGDTTIEDIDILIDSFDKYYNS